MAQKTKRSTFTIASVSPVDSEEPEIPSVTVARFTADSGTAELRFYRDESASDAESLRFCPPAAQVSTRTCGCDQDCSLWLLAD